LVSNPDAHAGTEAVSEKSGVGKTILPGTGRRFGALPTWIGRQAFLLGRIFGFYPEEAIALRAT
jgi:hypothetical protein